MPAVRQVLFKSKGVPVNWSFPPQEDVFDLVFDHYNDTGPTIATDPDLIEQALKTILPFDIAVKIKREDCPPVIIKNSKAKNRILLWAGTGRWGSIYELLPFVDKLVLDKEKKLNFILKPESR